MYIVTLLGGVFFLVLYILYYCLYFHLGVTPKLRISNILPPTKGTNAAVIIRLVVSVCPSVCLSVCLSCSFCDF